MSKRKYSIIDDNGEEVGFVVIEQGQAPTFQHAVGSGPVGGALADATLFVVVLGGFTAVAWFLPGPDWLAPAIGLTVTATLAGIKAWRGAGPLDGPDSPDQVTIKLESWSNEGQVLLSEIQDQTVSLEDWRNLARAIVKDRVNFSRPALARYISQTVYHKVVREFTYQGQGWIEKRGNNYLLGPRAIDFLLKVRTLPHE